LTGYWMMSVDMMVDMKVPGRKNSVTTVMIFIETVSFLVWCASLFIFFVRVAISVVCSSALRAKSLLASMLRKLKISYALGR